MAAADARNVLFLISHDFAPIMGAFRDPQAVTPNIDRLAGGAVVFESHYCQFPLCGPSRASLYSGLYPPDSRRWFHQPGYFESLYGRMGEGFATLPHWFRRQGYHTRGYWNFHHDVHENAEAWDVLWHRPKPRNEAWFPEVGGDGFLHHNWVAPESRALMKSRLDALLAAGGDPLKDQVKWRGPAVEGPDVPDTAYSAGMTAEAVVEFLQTRSGDQPFFLGVGFDTGHLPWNSPKKYWDLYDRDALRLPPWRKPPEGVPEWAYGDREPTRYYQTSGYDTVWEPSPEEEKELLHGYYAAVSYWDAQIGKILDALEASGHADDTMVVLTSDHGFNYGQNNYWGKHCLRDDSLHAPLIIRVPGGKAHRVTQPTQHVDVFPTLCDLAGIGAPGWLQGRSLRPLLENPDASWRDCAWAWRRPLPEDRLREYHEAVSLRTGTFRFNRYVDKDGNVLLRELYDYAADPGQKRNLADDPARAGIVAALEQRLIEEAPQKQLP